MERHEANGRGHCAGGLQHRKRQRTAALQNLAEPVARVASRQRFGVRLSSAALAPVHWQTPFRFVGAECGKMEPSHVGCYETNSFNAQLPFLRLLYRQAYFDR